MELCQAKHLDQQGKMSGQRIWLWVEPKSRVDEEIDLHRRAVWVHEKFRSLEYLALSR